MAEPYCWLVRSIQLYFSGMNLSLRAATREDAVLIADFSRKTFYDTFAAANTKANMDKFMDRQFTRGKLLLEAGRKDLQFYLAYAGDQVAGYVKLRDGKWPQDLQPLPALEIARLYADSTMIGKGVGALLMQKSIEVAQSNNKAAIWLGVWEKNARAIDFYAKWGFKKFSEQDFVLGDDVQTDWLMKKDL